MNSSEFSRVRRLFEAAMNLPDSQQRPFVERFCVNAPVVRDEVLGLLAADKEDDSERRLLDEGGLKRTSVVEIPEKIGPYRAVSIIATGGMGMVYEGIQGAPRRRVAIKTLLIGPRDERALARFEAEIEVLARLEHPSIARIYSAGTYSQRVGEEERELPYYVMEYIEGASTLTDYVEKKGLSIRKRLQLFRQVCEAVEFAHAQGVVHRDLKPGNILVDGDGRPKVIDFGTARLSGDNEGESRGMTRSGEILGTLNYMSPEQLSPTDDPPDARADIYSLGCVLYELLAERPAYSAKGRTFPEMVASVVTGTVQPPSHWEPSLSRALDLVCMKAMSKKREDRYQSTNELAADVQRFLDAREVHAAAPSVSRKVALFVRRQPAVVMAMLILFSAFGAGSYFVKREKSRHEELTRLADEAWTQVREKDLRDQSLRQGLSSALRDLSTGAVRRHDEEQVMESLRPMQGTPWMDEMALSANRSEVAAALARELRFQDRARALYGEALETWTAARGEGDDSTMRVKLALLALEHERGALDGFEERLAKLRAEIPDEKRGLVEERFGTDYLRVCLLLDAGRLEDAEASAWELLHGQTNGLGADHLDALETSWLLGRVLMWQGRGAAAVQHLERAHAGLQTCLGQLHPKTLECQVDFAVSLIPSQSQRAHEMLRFAQKNLGLILGEGHPSTLHARVFSLRLLMEGEPTSELKTDVDRTLVLCRAMLGNDHSLTRLCDEVQGRLTVVRAKRP